MPLKCCVPNCSSNYKSQLDATSSKNHTTIFKFPKGDLGEKWAKAIPRENWKPTESSAVCSKHFVDEDLERTKIILDANKIPKEVLKERPSYKQGAIPRIFPNCPKYLNIPKEKERGDPSIRKEKLVEKENLAQEQWIKDDIITDSAQFHQKLVKFHAELRNKWYLAQCEKKVIFYKLDFSADVPQFDVSVTVTEDLSIQVCFGTQMLLKSELRWILNGNCKLERWSQLENILSRYGSPSFTFSSSCKDSVLQLTDKLKDVIEDDVQHEVEVHNKILFLIEQIKLCFMEKKEYSSNAILSAFLLYEQSSSAYNVVRENLLILPHPKYLDQLTRRCRISAGDESENEHFLEIIVSRLTELQKEIILQMDEIYVKPQLMYVSGTIRGAADNLDSAVARTVQTFLMSSAFGHMKEVVALYPVKKLTGIQLADYTRKVINLLERHSLTVIVLISDDNRTNQNMFEELKPYLEEKGIKVMYDPVHILKNLRNNLLNKRAFLIPEFNDFPNPERVEVGESMLGVMFEDIIRLYQKEMNQLVKQAPKLSYKALFPSNLERQKVSLAMKIFDETTIAGLKCNEGHEGTILFLDLVRKWITIFNVKNPLQGIKTRNPLAMPFATEDDERLQFLRKFIRWLQHWEQVSLMFDTRFLTADTYKALVQTTETMVEIIQTFLCRPNVKYILPGKFQTDNTEHHFSNYRQLSGGNYNVSVQQILEAEKKLRMKSLLGTKSAKYGQIQFRIQTITELYPLDELENVNPNCDIKMFDGILDHYEENDVSIDESALLYTGGYAAFQVSNQIYCQLCSEFFCAAQTEDAYFQDLNRGGLTVPSTHTEIVAQHAHTILHLLRSEDYEAAFLRATNQKQILMKLTRDVLLIDDNFSQQNLCACKRSHFDLVDMLLPIFANILLKNYVKEHNDLATLSKYQGKKRKADTLKN